MIYFLFLDFVHVPTCGLVLVGEAPKNLMSRTHFDVLVSTKKYLVQLLLRWWKWTIYRVCRVTSA